MKSKLTFTILAVFVLLAGLLGTVNPVSATTPPPGENLSATIVGGGFWQQMFYWNISKSVKPAVWNLFEGDSGTSEYTVSATKVLHAEKIQLKSKLCITNNTAVATEGLVVTISVVQDGTGTSVTDFYQAPDFSAGIPAQTTVCGDLGANINPALLASGRSFTITADFNSINVPGGSVSTSASIPASPGIISPPLEVTDTNGHGSPWTFTDSGTQVYSETFTCGESGVHNNTATGVFYIGQTRKEVSASTAVTVNCYDLSVTKDASTKFNRKYQWDIAKVGSQSALTLALGEKFLVNYSVTVGLDSITPYVDSGWAVSGNIAVQNPAPIPATINSVGDLVSPAIAAAVNCGVTFPYTLAAGGTLNCTYGVDLPDGSARTNTATAVLQNYSYDKDKVATPSGTTGFAGTAAVSFAAATMGEVDECINVTDSLGGAIGVVCKNDTLPKTFSYSYSVGPYNVCGPYQVKNIASFTTNDTAATGSAEWTVNITVPCETGCSLTPGYWKTHSSYGPAPYDDTWAQLPYAEGTPFFLSGKSWYDVLWTAPKGNAYYILAHAYIAAYLNDLNGANIGTITADMAWAASFFATHTPGASLTSAERAEVIARAATLDNYNNGLIGPGHCNE